MGGVSEMIYSLLYKKGEKGLKVTFYAVGKYNLYSQLITQICCCFLLDGFFWSRYSCYFMTVVTMCHFNLFLSCFFL